MGDLRRSIGATLGARAHASALLLLGLVVLAYLWPVLIGGEILSPIADLYAYVPWQHVAPYDVHSYSNPLLIDLPLVDYPWRFLARQLIRAGTFPAWNPYVLGGIPFFPNPQTGIFSPFNLPLWILPLTYGLGVSAALKLLAGAFGTYLLVRQLRLGFLPGLLAGIAFAFSALNITWLSHETLPGVAVMLPWAIWSVERAFERGRIGDAIGLALAIAIGLGGGHPGMQVHLILVTGVYAFVRAACSRGDKRLRALVLIGAGLGAGALLMAFMLIPEARSSQDTVGVLARKAGSLPGDHMPFTAIRTVVFPDWWGRPTGIEGLSRIAARLNFNERTFYPGVVALLLACVGLVSRRDWRRKGPFALVGTLGLAVALDAPGLHWLATHLPVLDSVQSQRLHFAFAFAVAVLAAFGLQALLHGPARDRRRLAVPLVAILGGLIALLTAGAKAGDVSRTVTHFLHGTDAARAGVLALTSVVWFLLFALGVGAALLLAQVQPGWRVAIAVAIVLLAAGDAYHFAHGYNPMGRESKIVPPVTPAIAYLERHSGEGRIAGLEYALPNDWPLVYGLEDVRGYDPPQPTRRMLNLWQVGNPGQISWKPLALDNVSPQLAQVLGVLRGRFIVAPPGTEIASSGHDTLKTVYSGPDAMIVANADAAPPTLVPATAIVTTDEHATLATIAEPRFDPRTTVAIERDQPGVAALARASPMAARLPAAHGTVTLAGRQNSGVTLHATLDRRGLVVLNDALADGWSVRVDGRSAPALRVNDVMRGVIVPSGRHAIVWSYRVPGLRLGALLSLLTLAALIGIAVLKEGSARSSRAPTRPPAADPAAR